MPDSLFHAFCLAAPHSGGGKTTLALALMRAFRNRGLAVQGFKCGPDYIDPSFHQQATGRVSPNLDTWMMGKQGVRSVWDRHTVNADIAICEGVMGLFDSRTPGELAGSTADCALTLGLPVILVVQAKGMAGSLAPIVAGFCDFHPELRIAGVIANRVGSPKHAALLKEALHREGLPPLLGALPYQKDWVLPERQLGLIPAEESDLRENWYDTLAEAAEEFIELDTLRKLCSCPRPVAQPPVLFEHQETGKNQKRMGIARDRAFCFYYEENEAALLKQGWELVAFSPLKDKFLPPDLDALYLGGGYPEVFAEELSANVSMREDIRRFAENGKEIFAECGGYMYLAKALTTKEGKEYPFCGVINGTAHMGTQLRSLGYREVTLHGYPFAEALPADRLRGHEFHWSKMELHQDYSPLYSFTDREGKQQQDGVCQGNIKAGYIHLYWASLPEKTSKHSQDSPQKNGRVLLLNGASSAGKTTLAQELSRLLPQPNMVFSIDHFLPLCGTSGDSVAEAIDKTGFPLIEIFHAALASAAEKGVLVIADHVIGEKREWFRDLKKRLKTIPLTSIKVLCQTDVLISRETARTDRAPDPSHALRQSQNIHEAISYDLEVDTTQNSAEACARFLHKSLIDQSFFSTSSHSSPS